MIIFATSCTYVCFCVFYVWKLYSGGISISLAVWFVLGSGVTHAVWNLLTKKSENKQLFLFLIYVPATLLLLPAFIAEIVSAQVPLSGYLLLLLSVLIQAGYAYFLSRSLTLGDLSQVYPMMRGIATFLLPLCGAIFLNEQLSTLGWVGLGLIALGFFLLSGFYRKSSSFQISGKVLMSVVAVGLCTMSYVLVDKINLRYFSPAALLEVSNFGFMAGLVPFIRFREISWSRQMRENWRLLAAGSILSPGSYLLFLIAMSMSQLTYVAPLREIGTVIGTFMGVWLLKESGGARRLVFATIIFAGILLVGMFGM